MLSITILTKKYCSTLGANFFHLMSQNLYNFVKQRMSKIKGENRELKVIKQKVQMSSN